MLLRCFRKLVSQNSLAFTIKIMSAILELDLLISPFLSTEGNSALRATLKIDERAKKKIALKEQFVSISSKR